MLLRYFFTVIAVLGIGTSAYAVPVQTTYSYVGADYKYLPGSQFSYNGDPYQLPGTDYAAVLGQRLTASVTLDGDTSTFTGLYTTGNLGNPVGYRGVLDFSFVSGPVAFDLDLFGNFSLQLMNGAITDPARTVQHCRNA
jgi:hypothetical protein